MADLRRESMRIAGEHVGAGERVIEVGNPWTGAVVGTVPKGSVADVRRAFAAARAFRSPLSRHDRSLILSRAAERLAARREEIADLITAESGLCKKDTLYEVGRACDVFTFAAHAALNGRQPDVLLRRQRPRPPPAHPHAARAPARDQRHHAVQPPAEPGRAQGGAVHRHEQHDGAQALREDVRSPRCCSPTCSTTWACRPRCSRWSPATRARSPTSSSPIPTPS